MCIVNKPPMLRSALVVDDSMLIRHTVCRFLEERGFTVESAANGVEALEVLDTMTPDCIVTDLQMPKMSGLELIAALRSRPSTASIPIIVLTGTHGATSHSEGFPHLVCKDIDLEAELGRVLEEVGAPATTPA